MIEVFRTVGMVLPCFLLCACGPNLPPNNGVPWRSLESLDEVGRAEIRHQMIAQYPDWPDDVKAMIARGEISKGMSRQQVACAWGAPTEVQRVWKGPRGGPQAWKYSGVSPKVSLYFPYDRLIDVNLFLPDGSQRHPLYRETITVSLPPPTPSESR